MENESVSSEASDSTPLTRSKVHICAVCGREFSSGKALGGHKRIHMNGNNNGGSSRKISKSKKRTYEAVLDDEDDDGDKVNCCVCNKAFKSMKSLFGHMRNHPERSWRGVRPPPSDKNSCSSSVSEVDEALEIDQGSSFASSPPRWPKSDENEILRAAYILMKLASGGSFELGQPSVGYHSTPADKLSIDETRSRGTPKSNVREGKRKLCDEFQHRNTAVKAEIIENNSCSDQFKRFKVKISPNSHVRPYEAPVDETTPPAAVEGKRRYPDTLFHKRDSNTAECSDQVRSNTRLVIDVNEVPCVDVDDETT